QRGKKQNDSDQQAERQHIADRGDPGRAKRANQEIRATQEEISQRQRAPESNAVGQRAAEYRHHPNRATKNAAKACSFLRRKLQCFVKVASKRGEYRVVRQALKNLTDIGHPEGALETAADLLQALG